jgi:hypothetical protein
VGYDRLGAKIDALEVDSDGIVPVFLGKLHQRWAWKPARCPHVIEENVDPPPALKRAINELSAVPGTPHVSAHEQDSVVLGQFLWLTDVSDRYPRTAS